MESGKVVMNKATDAILNAAGAKNVNITFNKN
jgi:hypothetical protein